MPQSIVSSSIIDARRCSCGSRRGWTVTRSGMLTWDSAIRLTTSWEIAVFTATGNSACGLAGPRPAAGGRDGLADLGEDLLQLALVVLQRLLGLFQGDVAATDQGLGVELAHRALLVDQVVHQRLGEGRVVATRCDRGGGSR